MTYAFYVAALLAACLLAANSALASSTAQQSTTQSSDSGSTPSSSSSVTVSNSSVSSRTSSAGGLQIEQNLSGKIASALVNLTSGEVEAVLFGDWTLNDTGFVADFAMTPANGSGIVEYNMSGLQLHSVQEINDTLVLAGTIDIASNSTAAIPDAPVTIMIQDGTLVVGFGKDAPAGQLFEGIPVIGIAR